MGLLRSAFLAASRSAALGRLLPRLPMTGRAVRRFLPGETLADALAAAERLGRGGMGAVLTQLGENVTDAAQADTVLHHYLEVLDAVSLRGLDAEVSVKLTHLGLDLDRAACETRLARLAQRADQRNGFLWVDMEGSAYTDAALELYRRVKARATRVGVCVQAYLRRTAGDLEDLIGQRAAVRLVKGAYQEPAKLAYTTKRDVNESYARLARRLLGPDARAARVRAVLGTHDVPLFRRIAGDDKLELHMLYGIRGDDQRRLAGEGHRVKVLISYGSAWFAWYMRRLAERPANAWFLLRGLVG